jgi:hypothetical protein
MVAAGKALHEQIVSPLFRRHCAQADCVAPPISPTQAVDEVLICLCESCAR